MILWVTVLKMTTTQKIAEQCTASCLGAAQDVISVLRAKEEGSSAIAASIERFIRLDKTAFHPLPGIRPQLPGLIPDVLLVPAGSTRNA